MRLADRVMVVTGATGIAGAAARRLSREGAAVFVVSRGEDECRELAADLGDSAGWAAAELSDEAATVAAFDRARDRFGRIDGLLAVAGSSGRRFGDGPIHEMPLEGWSATFEANGHPLFLAAREAVRTMIRQEPASSGTRGSIVIVSSVLARHPSPELFATHGYAAVKGAALSLTRAMAAYYAPRLVRVNAVAPALVATPMSARAGSDPASVSYAARKQPLAQGFLSADDIAHAAVYLLSDEARHVTGQVIEVDGGWGVTEVPV